MQPPNPPSPPSIDVSTLPPNVVATGEAYNPLDPSYAANPYAFYARARREAPVCYSPRFNAFVITGADEFQTVMKDPARFSSRHNMDPMWPWPPEVIEILSKSPGGAYPAPGLFNNDPPGHTRVRALFSQVLTAGRILEMEPAIRAIAHGLVDGFVADGQADAVARFTYPLPMKVLGELMALPDDELPQLKRWSAEVVFLSAVPTPVEQAVALARGVVQFKEYCLRKIEERRRSPGGDLVSALVRASADGVPGFTNEEIISHMLLMFVAGHETTTSGIAAVLHLLLTHPDVWRATGSDPKLAEAAFEEAVRLEAPVQVEPRVATVDTEVGGVKIPRGAVLHMAYAAASRSEALFPDPDRFDPRRANLHRHFSFGHGLHYCIGAALARLEGRVSIEVLGKRLPNLRIAEGFVPEYDFNIILRGLKRLPLQWDAPR